MYPRNYWEIAGLSLEALVLCAGRLQLPLPTLPSLSSPRPFRSEGNLQALCGGTGHKLNSNKCVCMGDRCLLPTRAWELEHSYTLIEEGHWKTLYSTHIHVGQEQRFNMLFSQPLPATNMRMLASMSTVRHDAGGYCPELSSHREACLEAISQIDAFLWQRVGSSIVSQEFPRLPLYCTWRYRPGLHC